MAIQPSDLTKENIVKSKIEDYVDRIELILDQQIISKAHQHIMEISVLSDFYNKIPYPCEAKEGDVLAVIQRRYHGWNVSYFNECSESTGWERFSGLRFKPKGV